MSKPRYIWWGYVKNMIRRYPSLKIKYPYTNGMKAVPICELPSTEQREVEVVRRAIETTENYVNGQERLAIIDMALWKGSHTLEGAAMQIPCSAKLAKQWHGDFIRLVAGFYGLMDF